MRRALPVALLVLLLALPAALPGQAQGAGFRAAAASSDVTPPPASAASDARYLPACGVDEAALRLLWPGARPFAFTEPYVDVYGLGRYVPGDPFCDANLNGRFDAPWLAGGSSADRWPLAADAANPLRADVVLLELGGTRIALVTLDSIGAFNTAFDQMRAAVRARGLDVDLHGSSSHDESAPDPVGLWGPDGSLMPVPPDARDALTLLPLSSGVDDDYMAWLAERVADAVQQADARLVPAELRLAVTGLPSSVQSCWSSYPYIDEQRIPVVQGAERGTGRVLFTLVNVPTHVETLAFSHVFAYTHLLSADWPGPMRRALEQRWPGSVGVEMTSLVGSVETPTVYDPPGVQVLDVPGPRHGVSGNPNGCTSVYPEPAGGTPVRDAYAFLDAYGSRLADQAIAALSHAETVTPAALHAERAPLCVQLENNLFAVAFAAGVFPTRPAFADPLCAVGVSTGHQVAAPELLPVADVHAPAPLFVRTEVALVTIGPAQVAYAPGEVFPFTLLRGPMDASRMPFPTDCYNPLTEDYECGNPLPMTPWVGAEMQGRYRLFAGLGEDMVGYLFPPGNFVGDTGEAAELPWAAYQVQHGGDHDRFGYGHPDDSESLGPYAGLAVAEALSGLARAQGPGLRVEPGLFLDAQGRTSVSPFPGAGFGGAVGVVALEGGQRVAHRLGDGASGFVTWDGWPDPGTAGTAYAYSVSTAGVQLPDGPLLVDVFAGSGQLG